ncbi:MAG: hypothetical protein KQ78_02189 [Candidatus Izimaplasma bacterium HR2]|nr:MAG: hypothetical protein KQ78_02189 [Candidatus Izimaplasma bacterium HR2]
MENMLNTETYLRDMTREMGANHEPVASRPYTEMWDNYLNTENNICIFAPRGSGKTYALKHKFLDTPNSVYMTPNIYGPDSINRVRDWCRGQRQIRDDLHYNRDIFSLETVYRLRSRSFNTIFIDDVESYRKPLDILMSNIWPSVSHGGKIIMVSTPTGMNTREMYERYCNCVYLPQDWIDNNRIPETIENYFEDGLFEI